MKRFSLVLFLLVSLNIVGQQKTASSFNFAGKIIDASTMEPIEYATIILKPTTKDSIAFGGISDRKGMFEFEVKKGSYDIYIEFLSYKSKKLDLNSITEHTDVGTITLILDTNSLSEIEIVSQTKVLNLGSNKTVYNVSKDLTSNGGMVTDILNNIPEVNVDIDGNITLRGQPNATVMINGRISAMSKSEALKSLPAGSISRIEVIANPSARYKASSMGVINIILKRGQDEGLNGSITGTGGFKDYYGGLLNLNNKSKSVNFYTNTSFFHRNPIKEATYKNEYYIPNSSSIFTDEVSQHNNNANGFITNIGADFSLSENTLFSAEINYQKIKNDNTSKTITEFLNTPNGSNDRVLLENFDNELFEYFLNFEHEFGNSGNKFTASFTHTDDTDTFDNSISNSNANFLNDAFFIENQMKNNIFNVDFSGNFGKHSSYMFGYNLEQGNIPFRYTGIQTNHVDYNEKINAFFAEYEYEGEKMYYGIGLRAELSDIKLDALNANSTIKSDFNDLFPTLYVEYSISDNKSLSVSYNRSILRPSYNLLNPYEQRISELSTFRGNDQLSPMYANLSTLTYNYSGRKFNFRPSLFYNSYQDYMQDVSYETGNKINDAPKIVHTIGNVGDMKYYGASISTSIYPHKNLSFTSEILLVNYEHKGTFKTTNDNNELIERNFNAKNFEGSMSLLTQLNIPKVLKIQSRIYHTMDKVDSFFEKKSFTYATLAIQKDVFKDKASISLTVDDIFKSNILKRNRFDSNYFSKSVITPKYRKILLSFTYRFNQSKKDKSINFDKKENSPNY